MHRARFFVTPFCRFCEAADRSCVLYRNVSQIRVPQTQFVLPLHKLSVSWGLRLSFWEKENPSVCVRVYPHASWKMGLAANCCENRVSRHNAKCIARKNWKPQHEGKRAQSNERLLRSFSTPKNLSGGGGGLRARKIPVVVRKRHGKFLHARGGNSKGGKFWMSLLCLTFDIYSTNKKLVNKKSTTIYFFIAFAIYKIKKKHIW